MGGHHPEQGRDVGRAQGRAGFVQRGVGDLRKAGQCARQRVQGALGLFRDRKVGVDGRIEGASALVARSKDAHGRGLQNDPDHPLSIWWPGKRRVERPVDLRAGGPKPPTPPTIENAPGIIQGAP
jgi:hypothetical protein